jgi:hypothetical protein
MGNAEMPKSYQKTEHWWLASSATYTMHMGEDEIIPK